MKIATTKEIREYLKLNEPTISTLALKGVLPGFRIGKSWRFDLNAILRDIEKQKKKKGASDDDDGIDKCD